MMMITILLPVVLCSVASGQLMPSLFNEHEQINKYLVEKASEDDLKANVELARGWVTKLKLEEPLFLNKQLVKSLELFASLKDTWMLSGCTMESYQILRKNNEAFRGRNLHCPNLDTSSLSRMEKIVRGYSVHHAAFCRKAYPEAYKLSYKLALKKPQLRLKKLFYLLFKEYQSFKSPDKPFEPLNTETLEEMGRDLKLFEYPSSSEAVLQGLRSLSKDDPERKYLYKLGSNMDDSFSVPLDVRKRRTKVAGLLNSYLLEPCRFFTKTFGGIFIPAEYDEELIGRTGRADDEDALWFQIGHGHFKICQRLLSETKEVDLLIKGVESAIERSE